MLFEVSLVVSALLMPEIAAAADAGQLLMHGVRGGGRSLQSSSSSSSSHPLVLEPPLPGVWPGVIRPKVILAGDISYPPYSMLNEASEEINGFAPDFARAMVNNNVTTGDDVCNIEMYVVETDWKRCWNDGKIGEGLAMGEYHGCTSYTHSKGERNRFLEFSHPIINDGKPAGILTRLNDDGVPHVDGNSNLSGLKMVNVVGWAPTPDTLAYVKNSCTNNSSFTGYTWVDPTYNTGNENDDALLTLLNGEADAMWVYADQAENYQCHDSNIPGTKNGSPDWNCTLWSGFGTDFAYIQTGMDGFFHTGTTLSMSKIGSGVRNILNPCIEQFIKTEEYYNLCEKYNLTATCFQNEFFPPAELQEMAVHPSPHLERTIDLKTTCAEGYCSCPSSSSWSPFGN